MPVVRGAGLSVPKGRTVALLGESGCGKSVTSLAVMGLLEPPGIIEKGRIHFQRVNGGGAADLTRLSPNDKDWLSIRGREIAMIFQEPRSSLAPVYTIGHQIGESLEIHHKMTRHAARDRVVELLGEVGIPAPSRRVDEYPHQLSGGMCQRAMIAMALACRPSLLIADEPTTALDVTIQAQVLDLLRSLQKSHGMSMVFVTHDMHVVAEIADEVVVMYLGMIMESGPVVEIFNNPKHPYTRGLFECIPTPDSDRSKPLPRVSGNVPEPANAPEGCPFRGRCPHEMDQCMVMPPLVKSGEGMGKVACWLHPEVSP